MAKKSDDAQNKYDALILDTLKKQGDRLDDIAKDLRKNTIQTVQTNGTVKRHTKEIANIMKILTDRVSPKRILFNKLVNDPKILYLIVAILGYIALSLVKGGAPLPNLGGV